LREWDISMSIRLDRQKNRLILFELLH